MPHGHKLVNQAMTANVALGTLAANTAIVLNNAFNNPSNSFLMKRVRYFLQFIGRTLTDDGPILVGIANGNASLAEIAAAMLEGNTVGPADITETLTQDESWVVYQNTVVPFVTRGDGSEAQTDGKWIAFGGKNGIPAIENSGWQLFAFNAGQGALSTGSNVSGNTQIQGVWLND